MKYPKGAIRSLEEMKKCLGKPVYLVLLPGVGGEAPRPHPHIIKITPTEIQGVDYNILVKTMERVFAADDHGIATNSNMTVGWGDVPDTPRFYFPNFWHAYAHSLKVNR